VFFIIVKNVGTDLPTVLETALYKYFLKHIKENRFIQGEYAQSGLHHTNMGLGV